MLLTIKLIWLLLSWRCRLPFGHVLAHLTNLVVQVLEVDLDLVVAALKFLANLVASFLREANDLASLLAIFLDESLLAVLACV